MRKLLPIALSIILAGVAAADTSNNAADINGMINDSGYASSSTTEASKETGPNSNTNDDKTSPSSLNPATVSDTTKLVPANKVPARDKNDLTINSPQANLNEAAKVSTVTGTDLWQIYQLAANNDQTYQAAVANFAAQKQNVPIAFAAMLPGVSASANTTWNENENSANYNVNGYSLSISQPLFNFGSWKTYSQSEVNAKIQALVLAEAEQTLVMNVATDYFQVLADQDNLRYAKANEEALKQSLMQVEQRYRVGLAAMSDVQSARSQYEQAIATSVKAENSVANDLETLAVLTGQSVKSLAQLKAQFNLFKPEPANADDWTNVGMKQNLTLQQAYLQVDADRLGIDIQRAGFLPTVTGSANYANAVSHSTSPATSSTTKNIGISANYAIFSGFATQANVKKAQYTVEADAATAENQARQTTSSIRQDYLNVLSDISQIQAYQQAVISGQSSLDAARAAYEVGTKTLVDLLNQQSTLFQNQQLYVSAIQNYISDSLKLKQDSGLLSANDLSMINNWLLQTANNKKTDSKNS